MNKKKLNQSGQTPALSGNWKNTTFWNFYMSSELPENAILTTVTGLIIWENKIVLVENNRGWDLPGGHIEENETPEGALARELYEEAGIEHMHYFEMFGYNQIINPEGEKINKVNGKPYPKYAYNPHFIVEINKKPLGCQDGTCKNVGFFNIESEQISNSRVKDIITLGYKFYLNKKA